MNKNDSIVKSTMKELKEFAKEHGFKIRFRTVPTDCGDFCIFIYKNGESKYLVGYDGYWENGTSISFMTPGIGSWNASFYGCCKAVYGYIENYETKNK